jgi:hypothetical protein
MKVANSIEILEETKIDFVQDQNGNPTEETYEYKEVLVKDINGDILEIFRVGTNLETEDQFFSQTGVKIGISSWF